MIIKKGGSPSLVASMTTLMAVLHSQLYLPGIVNNTVSYHAVMFYTIRTSKK